MLKEELLRLLREDDDLKREIKQLLAPEVASKNDLQAVLQEIKQLREDFILMNAEIKQLREDFNRIDAEIKQLREDFQAEIKQLREDFNRIDAEIKQLREDFNRMNAEIKQLREDFQAEIRQLRNMISALGARWGRDNERTILNAFREFFEDRFNVKVKNWVTLDEKGTVFGHPAEVEVDIVIHDGEHWLLECKSRARRADVAELARIATLYEEKEGVKPSKLYIVAPFVDPEAYKLATMLKVDIISYGSSE